MRIFSNDIVHFFSLYTHPLQKFIEKSVVVLLFNYMFLTV